MIARKLWDHFGLAYHMILFRSPTAAAVNRTFSLLSQCFVFIVLVEVPAIFVNAAEYVSLQAQALSCRDRNKLIPSEQQIVV